MSQVKIIGNLPVIEQDPDCPARLHPRPQHRNDLGFDLEARRVNGLALAIGESCPLGLAETLAVSGLFVGISAKGGGSLALETWIGSEKRAMNKLRHELKIAEIISSPK